MFYQQKRLKRNERLEEKTQQIGQLKVNSIVDGTVEKIAPYGAFIDIGEGLTGLCHISQITNKFIKSPKEVLKLGDSVKAKIIKIEGDRISLSIKAIMEDEADSGEEQYEIPEEYRAGKETADESPFAKLLKDIKL